MSFCAFLILFFCSYGSGYNSNRQPGAYHWYDQVVLPTVTSVHQHQLYHQLPDRTAVVFSPQYSEQENERRSEPEQVLMDYRLARVYPVLIHFLSPEEPGNLGAQYQLTLEPVPEYQMMEIRESKYPEQDRTEERPSNETELLQFGTKVTTRRPTYQPPQDNSSSTTSNENTNEQ